MVDVNVALFNERPEPGSVGLCQYDETKGNIVVVDSVLGLTGAKIDKSVRNTKLRKRCFCILKQGKRNLVRILGLLNAALSKKGNDVRPCRVAKVDALCVGPANRFGNVLDESRLACSVVSSNDKDERVFAMLWVHHLFCVEARLGREAHGELFGRPNEEMRVNVSCDRRHVSARKCVAKVSEVGHIVLHGGGFGVDVFLDARGHKSHPFAEV